MNNLRKKLLDSIKHEVICTGGQRYRTANSPADKKAAFEALEAAEAAVDALREYFGLEEKE